MQEGVGAGKGLIVVQSNLAQELLCLQGEGARSWGASLGGGIQGSAAICGRTSGLVVIYFSSFRRIVVHGDRGRRGGLVVVAHPQKTRSLEEELRKEDGVRRGDAGQEYLLLSWARLGNLFLID